jgi:D-3-phosphoglycerate dehydrogenase
MSQRRVLVCDPISEKGIELLKASGLAVDVKLGLGEAELVENAPNYEGIIVRSGVKITAPVIEAGAGVLRAIGRDGVGVDNIDIKAASAHGIVVMNAPSGSATTTAEHTLALIFALARSIPAADASMKAGRWDKKKFMGIEVADFFQCATLDTSHE